MVITLGTDTDRCSMDFRSASMSLVVDRLEATGLGGRLGLLIVLDDLLLKYAKRSVGTYFVGVEGGSGSLGASFGGSFFLTGESSSRYSDNFADIT